MARRSLFSNLFIFSVFLNVTGLYINDTGVAIDSYDAVIHTDGLVDESILGKHRGYHYTPALFYMNVYCDRTLILNTRNAIRVSPWSSKYPPGTTTCKMGVRYNKHPDYQLGVTFKTIQLAPKIGSLCSRSRLDLFNGVSTSSIDRISEFGGICGTKSLKEQYSTSSDFLTMLYKTNQLRHSYQNFEAIITPFHYGTCKHDEFKCANSKCIKTNNLCNGYDNCGDNSDEKACPAVALTLAAIIGIAVGGAILVAIVIGIVCCCCCCASCGYERF